MTTSAADETRLDTQATQTADVTAPSGEDAELAELARWLDEPETTQDAEEQNPEPDETESDATTDAVEDDPELEAAVQARAERLAEEKAEQVRAEEQAARDQERNAERAQVQWQGIQESFRSRAGRIRGHLEAVTRGDAELNVNGILEEFNAHHAQMVNVRDAEWHNTLFQDTVAHMTAADKQRLEGLRRTGALPLNKLLEERDKALSAKAKEGMHPESRLKEEHARGALNYRSRLEKLLKESNGEERVLALLRSRTQPAATRTSNPPAPARTGANILTSPDSSMADVNRLLAEAGV